MTKKMKMILAGLFLLVLAMAGAAYAADWKCGACGMVMHMPDGSTPDIEGCSAGEYGHHIWNIQR